MDSDTEGKKMTVFACFLGSLNWTLFLDFISRLIFNLIEEDDAKGLDHPSNKDNNFYSFLYH